MENKFKFLVKMSFLRKIKNKSFIIGNIIVLIIIGALLGFVNGGIKTFVSAIGFIVVATISFMLKDIVAEVLFKICPFFNFLGLLKV